MANNQLIKKPAGANIAEKDLLDDMYLSNV